MATQASQKILRLGVIQNGNIIEERLLRTPETVTVGQSAKNTFTLVSDGVPQSATLLEYVKGRYILHFSDTMTGRVLVGDTLHDLAALRQAGKVRKSGNDWVIELDAKTRGKVVIGDVTILFQFVNPPPLKVAPQLPAHMRGGLLLFLRESVGLSGGFIGSLIASMVIQGGFLLYLLYVVPPPKRRSIMDAPPDLFVSILTQQPPETPPPEPDTDDDQAEPDDDDSEPVIVERPVERETPRTPEPEQRASRDENRTSTEIRDQARERVRTESALGALTSSDTGVGSIVAALADRPSNLRAEDIIANQAALGSGGDGIVSSTGIGTSADATANVGRAEIGSGEGRSSVARQAEVARTERQAEAVEVRSRIRGAEERMAGSGSLSSSNVAAVFRRREGDVRRCYERGLARDPGLGGRLVVQLTIGDGGRVDDVTLRTNELGDDVGTCVVGALRRWRFDAPQGGTVAVQKAYILAPGS